MIKQTLTEFGCDAPECTARIQITTGTPEAHTGRMVNHSMFHIAQQMIARGWAFDPKGQIFCKDHEPEIPN